MVSANHFLKSPETVRQKHDIKSMRPHALAALFALFLAAPSFSQAQSPEQAEIFARATQAMQQGNLEEAATGFSAVATQTPAFAEAHFNLGLVRQEQGQYDGAIASFRKALALKPRLHGANLFLGISQFRIN